MIVRILFIGVNYFAVAFIFLCAYLLGWLFLRRIQFDNILEEGVFSLTLGFGVLGHVLMLLGVVGALYVPVFWILMSAIIVFGSGRWSGWLQRLPYIFHTLKKSRYWNIIVTLVVMLVLSPLAILSMYPPMGWDVGMYHLALPKFYMTNHSLAYTEQIRCTNWPQLNEMIDMISMSMFSDVVAQATQFGMMVTLAAMIVSASIRYFSLRGGLYSAAIFLSSALVVWAGTYAYNDLCLSLFVFASIFSCANWLKGKERHWLVLTALMLGFAASVKYQASVFMVVVTFIVAFDSIRHRLWKELVIYGIVIVAAMSPWYIRSYILVHNPVAPFLCTWWGPGPMRLEEAKEFITDSISHYGGARTLKELLALPWNWTFQYQRFNGEGFVTPWLLILLPIGVVLMFKEKRLIFPFAISMVYLASWFFASQVLRYIIPSLTLLSLVSGVALDRITSRALLRLPSQARGILVTILCVFLVTPGSIYAAKRIIENGPLPVKQNERDDFLSRWCGYRSINYLNTTRGNKYTVYAMFVENMNYYADGCMLGERHGEWRYQRVIPKLSDGKALYDELRTMEAEFFLINKYKIIKFLGEYPCPGDTAFTERFRPVVSGPNEELYELAKPGTIYRRTESGELLKDPSFGIGTNNLPAGWKIIGKPEVVVHQTAEGKKEVTVRGDDSNYCLQLVTILPGDVYKISGIMKADRGHAMGRLHINWLDYKGVLLKVDIQSIPVKDKWMNAVTTFRAPDNAVKAWIVTDGYGKDGVLYKSISLRKVSYNTVSVDQ